MGWSETQSHLSDFSSCYLPKATPRGRVPRIRLERPWKHALPRHLRQQYLRSRFYEAVAAFLLWSSAYYREIYTRNSPLSLCAATSSKTLAGSQKVEEVRSRGSQKTCH